MQSAGICPHRKDMQCTQRISYSTRAVRAQVQRHHACSPHSVRVQAREKGESLSCKNSHGFHSKQASRSGFFLFPKMDCFKEESTYTSKHFPNSDFHKKRPKFVQRKTRRICHGLGGSRAKRKAKFWPKIKGLWPIWP